MNLKNLIKKKSVYTDYIVEEITTVIKKCGKRAPGSEGEKKAVEYMGAQLQQYTDTIKIEPFDVHPAAFMGWIYFMVSMMLGAFVALFFVPILSIILVTLSMVLMTAEFILYKKVIDPLFKKKTSYNLTAIKKPTGEVKRRIFLNGHPDAACEWSVNYHLGGKCFAAHFVISMIGIAYTLIVALIAVFTNGFGYNLAEGTIRILGLVNLIFVPFWIGMYFFWNEKIVTDGANDNLTGCYMGIAVLKALKDEGIELENTEVGVIISGSEEAGLRGAKAWSKSHKDEYKDVETLIFAFDTIHESKHLSVNVRDLNNMVKADSRAAELFYNSAKELNIPCSKGSVPLGGTDSAGFSQGGFQSVGITGLDHNLQRYYHTRKDTYDNLDKEGISNCLAATIKVLENFDNGR